LKKLHPRNPPNGETQISWYLTVQIQIEISSRICTEEFEFLKAADFGGVAFSGVSVIQAVEDP